MKQLIPIDDYGMFCDIESKKIKELKGKRVYVLKTNQGCKIGKSSDVYSRVKALKGMSPLKIDGIYITKECGNHSEIEKLAHMKFKNQQINSEWFDIGVEDIVLYLKTLNYKPIEHGTGAFNVDEIFDILYTPEFMKERNLKFRDYDGNLYIEDEQGNFMIPELFAQMVNCGLA